ncbi:MAG TPA: ABC transporter permease [Vicinamibacterales bacterium]|nr:ABC transporter permease [Vicinamibacterales bacterium]
MTQDIRYAIRTLLNAPAFTIVVVLTLALGIGANTAIFSLTDQLLLRLLPVKHPEQLVMFENPGPFQGRTNNSNTFSYPMYRDFRDRNTVFDGVLASFNASLTLTIDGQSERVMGELVSGNYFDVLGVRPFAGRVLMPDDDRVANGSQAAMISYGYWMRRFAGDRSILNRAIGLNGHPMTIVGITPPGFFGISIGQSADVLVPVTLKAQMTPTWDDLENRRSRWLVLMARLKPGLSAPQAEAGMNVLYHQINELEVKSVEGASAKTRERFLAKHLFVKPGAKGRSDLRQEFSTPIVVLMGMVGLVLLIACANVANLLLARGAARQKEVAIRLALGAGRRTIVRQRLVESLLLALAGAGIGLPLAWGATALLVHTLPSQSAEQTFVAAPDLRVVLFAVAVSLITAVLFGLAPAMQSTRPALTTTLKDESSGVVGGTGHARFRQALVIAQVGLSVLLLAGAGLFARSLYNLKNVNPGFDTEHLLAFAVDPSLSGYSRERTIRLFHDLQQRIAGIPEVRAVSPSVIPLLSDSEWRSSVTVEGYQAKEGADMNPDINSVGPQYFETMRQPLVAGREFTDRDVDGAPKVAIVNEAMAHYFFGDGNPLGRHLGLRKSNANDAEIVGVVKDFKNTNLREEPKRFVFLPYAQTDELNEMTLYVRARGDAAAASASLRAAVRQADANLPIYGLKTMTTQVDDSLFIERMVAGLSIAFGALATLLAAIGLYGVMSYSVARRTREIGIRMALGAERTSVLWMVLREVAVLVAVGVGIGVPVAIALGRVVQSQLFDLSATDPIALAVATALLATVAFVAGYLPARRATRVDPMLALRYE